MKRITSTIFALFFLLFVSGYAQDFTASPDVREPIEPELVEVEIHYDGPNTNGVGAADADFIIAARFTNTQLGPYVGTGFTKLRVYIRNATVGNTGTIRIYSAGTPTIPGPEIYSAPVTTTPDSWNEWVLSPFVPVPATDVWAGLQAVAGPAGVQFWGGVDAGPHHPDGQWIFFSGAWATLVSLNPALTYNWNIRIIVDTTVPVELTSFAAAVSGRDVTLNWATATELNNKGFEVQRKSDNNEFVTIGFVQGSGTTVEAQSYSFTDNNLEFGSYSYRLKQVDLNGNFEYSDEVLVDITAPQEFALDQNFPNPFNPSTRISFALAVDSKVSLKVFNLLGQEVASLIEGNISAGTHDIDFSANGMNSGVYFYTLEATGIDGTNFSSTKKMIFMK